MTSSPPDAVASRPERVRWKFPAGRWTRRLVILLIVAAVLIWLAPTIIAHSPLRQTLLRVAVPQFRGRLEVKSASLGWLSPIVLRDFSALEPEGETLLEVAEIRSENSLWRLLRNPHQLGAIRAQRARLRLVLRPDGSNLEDALAQLLGSSSGEASVECSLQLVDSVVDVADSNTGQSWSINALQAEAQFAQAGGSALSVQASGSVEGEGQPGSFQVQLECDETSLQDGLAKIQTNGFPLGLVDAVIKRLASGVDLRGVLHCNSRVAWNQARRSVTIERFAIEQLNVSAPSWLGSDTVRSGHLVASGGLQMHGNRLQLQNLSVESDLGSLQAEGAVDLNTFADQSWKGLLALAANEDYQVDGRLDLARLTQMLPATLRINPSTQLTSGTIQLAMSSRQVADHRHWQASLETSDVSATHHGQSIVWKEPLRLTMSARQSEQGPLVEQLQCRSSFLQLAAHGNLAEGTLSARGNLDRLIGEVSQLVDLGQLRLGGDLQADVKWEQNAQQQVDARGNLSIHRLELVLPGMQPIREDRVDAVLTAQGQLNSRYQLVKLDRAALRIQSDSDQLVAQLRQPVANVSRQANWHIGLQLGGELSRWLPRVGAFAPLAGWNADGVLDLALDTILSEDQIAVESCLCQLEPVRVWKGRIRIDEPRVVFQSAGSWNRAASSWTGGPTTITSSMIAARCDNLQLGWVDNHVQCSGDIGYRADLARLQRASQGEGVDSRLRLYGELIGKARLSRGSDTLRLAWEQEIRQLAIARHQTRRGSPPIQPAASSDPWEVVWREPRLTSSGEAIYDIRQGNLQLNQLAADAEALQLRGQGLVREPTRQCDVNFQGQIAYDLSRLSQQLRPWIGASVQFTGAQTQPLVLRGPLVQTAVARPDAEVALTGSAKTGPALSQPLVPKALEAQARVGWSSADILGLPVGQGQVQSQLVEGVVHFQPIDLQVSEGRVNVTPRIDLNADPAALHIKPGQVIQQVRISPELCRHWLKYVAPLVADATRAQGRFSLSLAGVDVPLVEPATGSISGTLTIDTAQLGPGPLAQQLLLLARQVKSLVERRLPTPGPLPDSDWLVLPPQNIDFQMAQGRVYHRGLQMTVNDVAIRTRGSVGLDQSLSLMAEVPIRDAWVDRNRQLAALQGQVLQVPISGTLSKPRIDTRALEHVSQQLLQGAATRLLEQELNRGLEKLFQP